MQETIAYKFTKQPAIQRPKSLLRWLSFQCPSFSNIHFKRNSFSFQVLSNNFISLLKCVCKHQLCEQQKMKKSKIFGFLFCLKINDFLASCMHAKLNSNKNYLQVWFLNQKLNPNLSNAAPKESKSKIM